MNHAHIRICAAALISHGIRVERAANMIRRARQNNPAGTASIDRSGTLLSTKMARIFRPDNKIN